MLPCTTGARPGKMNMMSLPYCAISRWLPERKPSPRPTSSSKEPTPQAMPNIVRNERNLCAQRVRKICAKMSRSIRIVLGYVYLTYLVRSLVAGNEVTGGNLKLPPYLLEVENSLFADQPLGGAHRAFGESAPRLGVMANIDGVGRRFEHQLVHADY